MTFSRSDPHAVTNPPASRALATAIIVPTGGLFLDQPPSQQREIGPLTQVGGLSLIQRTILSLQRAGLTDLVILAGPDEEALQRAVFEDRRMTALVRWMPLREFPVSDARTWESLVQDIQGPCLVVGAQAVFSRPLLEELKRQSERTNDLLVVTYPDDLPTRPHVAADLLVMPAGIASAGWRADPSAGLPPLRFLTKQAMVERRLKTIETTTDSPLWYQPVRRADDISRAERLLLRNTKSAYEGVIDTYFNRKVAALLTPLFIKARWSPNAVTALSLLIGFAAAACFAQGRYVTGIVGALLFQVAAVIDCCDGDVARVTFEESRFGEQLDILGDNLVHVTIFAALAWAGYKTGGGILPFVLGAAAIIGSGLSLWFVTRMKAWRDRQGWANPEQAARGNFIIDHVASRDFSVLVLLLAVVDQLHLFLWLTAVGSQVFWMLTAWVQRSAGVRA